MKFWELDDELLMRSREIRKFILGQTVPFCMVDLKKRAEAAGIKETRMLFDVFSQLLDEELVTYEEIRTTDQLAPKWAFHVA